MSHTDLQSLSVENLNDSAGAELRNGSVRWSRCCSQLERHAGDKTLLLSVEEQLLALEYWRCFLPQPVSYCNLWEYTNHSYRIIQKKSKTF